ncbi:MAG: histidine kinase [bacterium]|nr:histidine kinase [bacterium]
MRFTLNSLRARVLLLLLLIFIPVLILTLMNTEDQRRLTVAEAREDALFITENIAADNQQYIASTRQMLVALAQLPIVREKQIEPCNALLAQLLQEFDLYNNLFVIDTVTNATVCSAIPVTVDVDTTEYNWYQQTLETRAFAVGEYRIGPVTGLPAVTLSMPVFDEGNQLTAVVAAGLSLNWLNTSLRSVEVPPGTITTLVDSNGTILSRYPDDDVLTGERYNNAHVWATVLTQKQGVTRDQDLNGQMRLYGFTQIGGDEDAVYVIVGLLENALLADVQQVNQRNLLTLALITLLIVVLGWTSTRLITQPIENMTEAVRRIAAGQLSFRPTLDTEIIELQQLLLAFNDMATSVETNMRQRLDELADANQKLQQQIEERAQAEQERERLYEAEIQSRREAEKATERSARLQMLSAALSEALTTQQIAQVIVEQGGSVLNATTGAFYIVGDVPGQNVQDFIQVYITSSLLPARELQLWRQFEADPAYPITTVAQSKQALWLLPAEACTEQFPAMAAFAPYYPGGHVILPVLLREQVVALVTFSFSTIQTFSDEDRALMMAFTQLCAQALERVRLAEQAQEGAASQERQRLARDLHDAVSQVLFSATAMAEAVPRQWERNRERGKELLNEVIMLNRSAMAEMRTLLLELRPEAVGKTDLKMLFKQLIDAAKGRREIKGELVVNGDGAPLPITVHVAFYRIAQESVNNIIKHSQASRFTIQLDQDAEQTQLTVYDNGRGFNMEHLSAGLGMGNMRERAEAIGARFEMTSRPGDGTRIKVVWKYPQEED